MATYPTRYKMKPGRPRLQRGRPLAFGLVGAWVWPGGRGQDLAGTNHLTPTGAVAFDGFEGLKTSATATYSATVNPGLKLQMPLSIVWSGYQNGTPAANESFFGVIYNTPNTSPFSGYNLGINSVPNAYRGIFNNGTFQQVNMTSSGIADGRVFLAMTMATGNQPVYFQDPSGSNATPGTLTGTIGYTATSYVSFIGTNTVHEYGLIYNRQLSALEVHWLAYRGRDLFVDRRSRLGWEAALSGQSPFPYPARTFTGFPNGPAVIHHA